MHGHGHGVGESGTGFTGVLGIVNRLAPTREGRVFSRSAHRMEDGSRTIAPPD